MDGKWVPLIEGVSVEMHFGNHLPKIVLADDWFLGRVLRLVMLGF